MTSIRKITILVASATFFILTSCNSSGTPTESADKQVNGEPKSDSTTVESQVDQAVDSITCLDVSFIESLETGWSSNYKGERLTKKGFVFENSRTIKNGKERIFKNDPFSTNLTISNVEYPDGEIFFTVKYQVTPKQLPCFKENLNNSSLYQFDDGKYVKKGLGTYAEKYFSIDSDALWVTYTHRVGKELSLPPMEILDSIK